MWNFASQTSCSLYLTTLIFLHFKNPIYRWGAVNSTRFTDSTTHLMRMSNSKAVASMT